MGQKKIKTVKKAKGKKVQGQVRAFMALLILLAAVFFSTAILLFVGLLPMFVAFFTDKSRRKTKAITVGSLNLAGCVPFVLELWGTDRSMESALDLISDPMVIIVMYMAAGVGYLVDWAVTLFVANMLYQQGLARQKAIQKRQEQLVVRWGEEVTGDIAVDKDGFPVG